MENLRVKVTYPSLYDTVTLLDRYENLIIRFTIFTGDILERLVPDDILELTWIISTYEKLGFDVSNLLKF